MSEVPLPADVTGGRPRTRWSKDTTPCVKSLRSSYTALRPSYTGLYPSGDATPCRMTRVTLHSHVRCQEIYKGGDLKCDVVEGLGRQEDTRQDREIDVLLQGLNFGV